MLIVCAKMSLSYKRSKQKAPIRYIGETKNQLRHGHGVYVYENRFFRYEGQWENGKKHGHGKMLLGDGGYYEGTFVHGEIEGHGYRVFGLTGATYSGQFHHGEMHGQGILSYPNGEQYEGSWVEGRKEGTGILTAADGSVYEGGFHNNLRHGEGVQMYSNGDQYEGDWVMGKKHGHGMLRSAQGTIYDGQWRGDVYHGQGSITHSSGVTYEGMWINGRPANEPVQLRVSGGVTEFLVEQGKRFTVAFECVDSQGQVVLLESGRSFEVSAAVRKNVPRGNRSKSRFHQVVSQVLPDLPTLQVPFGYSAQPYELLQLPSNKSLSDSSTANENQSGHQSDDQDANGCSERNKKSTLDNDICRDTAEESSPNCLSITEVSKDNMLTIDNSGSSNPLHAKSEYLGHSPLRQRELSEVSKLESRSLVLSNKSQVTADKDGEFLSSLVTPLQSCTKQGEGVFEDLYFPPLPAPDLSQILGRSPSGTTALPKVTSNGSLLNNSRDNLAIVQEDEQDSPAQGTQNFMSLPSSSELPKPQPSSTGHSLTTSQSQKKLVGQESLPRVTSRKVNSKEKFIHVPREKYCPTGTYIIMISEVTEPPFLETRLPTLYVEVKVIPPNAMKSMDGPSDKVARSKTRLKWK